MCFQKVSYFSSRVCVCEELSKCASKEWSTWSHACVSEEWSK